MPLVPPVSLQFERIQRGQVRRWIAAGLDPSAHAAGMVFVGRIADADLDIALAFDCVRLLSLLGNQLECVRKLRLARTVGVFEGVSDVEIQSRGRHLRP